MFFTTGWIAGTFATHFTRQIPSYMGSACRKPREMEAQVDETFDVIVGDEAEVTEGCVKEVKLSENPPTSALLVKHKGTLHAVSNKCTHYGAPLSKGSFCPERGIIRCPWHGACFNVTNGDIEDFPGLDNLKSYQVNVVDGKVHVSMPLSPSPQVALEASDQQTVVIIGGGAAAQVCAETLRTRRVNPWKGQIIMICKESCPPYDRPKLSKALTASGHDLQLRPDEFYRRLGISLKLNGKRTTSTAFDKSGTKSCFRGSGADQCRGAQCDHQQKRRHQVRLPRPCLRRETTLTRGARTRPGQHICPSVARGRQQNRRGIARQTSRYVLIAFPK